MFTGIITEVGKVAAVSGSSRARRVSVDAPKSSASIAVGDSVSVSGACLTAVECDGRSFAVDVVSETLSRTTLGSLTVGDPVNVELSVAAGERFGGHFVLGHVDCVGRVAARRPEETGFRLRVEHDARFSPLAVEKGSVAVDGVSLTIASLGPAWFECAIVPHTVARTTLARLDEGNRVNVEFDVIAKHVAGFLGARSPLTFDELRRAGFADAWEEK